MEMFLVKSNVIETRDNVISTVECVVIWEQLQGASFTFKLPERDVM